MFKVKKVFINTKAEDYLLKIINFRLKNSMLADEADNPGFLLLLEQVALTSLFPLNEDEICYC